LFDLTNVNHNNKVTIVNIKIYTQVNRLQATKVN